MRPRHVFPEGLACWAELAAQLTLGPGSGHVPRLDVIDHVPVVCARVATLAALVRARVIGNHLRLDNLIQRLKHNRRPGAFLGK